MDGKRSLSESSSDGGEETLGGRKRLRTGSFYSERESEEESDAPPSFQQRDGFGHQRSSSSSSFGSPTSASRVGFGSPTRSTTSGFGSPTSTPVAFTFPTQQPGTGLGASFTSPTQQPGAAPGPGALMASGDASSLAAETKPVGAEETDGDADTFVIPENVNQPTYSNVAQRMMAKMGHKAGTGLGKHSQGRVNIVEASKQRGQRGLGHVVKSFEPADVQWDFDKETVVTDERVDWIPKCTGQLPSLETMRDWVKIGPKQEELDQDTDFCSEKTLLDVLKCKSVFDDLENEEMRRARTRSNPFETIRGAFFQNRAAMKMANMDAVLGFMFTDPKDPNGAPVVKGNELLYFADVCAGPGGFSEYVLWRKSWDAKGFGFTLKGNNDFKLEEFFSAHSELFEPHYGVGGLEGDGDVYRPDNLREFRRFVLQNTDGAGVHFFMADGGFDVAGKENFQEVLSKRLYLCQFLCALSILRPGGHFVCKLFDVFTLYSVGLIYLMWHAFEHVTIFKPVTSRPANSERYIVCKWKRPAAADALHDFLFEVNERYSRLGGVMATDDINELVPLDVIRSAPDFVKYMTESNEQLGRVQCVNLVKIQTFTKNSNLLEFRQAEIRQTCLKKWKIPDQMRTRPDNSTNGTQRFGQLITETDTSFLGREALRLTTENLSGIHSVFDYKCYVSGAEQSWLLLGMGKSNIWKWSGQAGTRWTKLDNVKMELPKDTLIRAEFVMELRGEGKGMRKVMGAHVTDALFLCGTNVMDLHYNERMEKARKLVKAITRTTRMDLAPVRVKDVFRFEDVQVILNKLSMRQVKGFGVQPRLCYSFDQERCCVPTGVHFIKVVQEPYMIAFSRSQNKKYFFNTMTREAVYHTPKETIATFKSCCSGRLFWSWSDGVQIHPQQPAPANQSSASHVTAQRMLSFIQSKLPPIR